MDAWYVLMEGPAGAEAAGPFTMDHLRAMASDGSLRASTRVARAGSDAWIPAASDPEVSRLFVSAAPPMVAPPPLTQTNAPTSYSFGNTFALAWTTFKARWAPLMLIVLVYIAMSVLLALPQLVADIIGDTARSRASAPAVVYLGSCVGFLLQILVGLPLAYGLMYAGANAVRGRSEVTDLFAPFKRYPAVLGSGVLVALIGIGCAIVAYAALFAFLGAGFLMTRASTPSPGTGLALVISGVVIAVVLLVVLAARIVCRVLLAPVICVDPALGSIGAMDSIRISWKNTEGLGPSIFGVLVVASVLAALTVLLLCVGYLLVGLPLLVAIYGALHVLVNRAR